MKSLYLTYIDSDYKTLKTLKNMAEKTIGKRIKWEDFIYIEVVKKYVGKKRANN